MARWTGAGLVDGDHPHLSVAKPGWRSRGVVPARAGAGRSTMGGRRHRWGEERVADRSIDAVRSAGWLLGGDGGPPGQLPPAMGPGPTPTTRRATAIPQPRMGGLLSLFGDAVLSQDLAQPGMLVVHVWFPSAARSGVQRSQSAVSSLASSACKPLLGSGCAAGTTSIAHYGDEPGRLIATSGTRSGCGVARWAASRVR